jgi:hypothetical protein
VAQRNTDSTLSQNKSCEQISNTRGFGIVPAHRRRLYTSKITFAAENILSLVVSSEE